MHHLKAETNCSHGIQLTFYPWSDNIGFFGELSSKQFIIYFHNSGNIFSNAYLLIEKKFLFGMKFTQHVDQY